MQEYIKELLINVVLLFVGFNIFIALTPVWIRKPVKLVLVSLFKTSKVTLIGLKKGFIWSKKNIASFYKSSAKSTKEVAKKGKGTTTAPESNVIPFPQRKTL